MPESPKLDPAQLTHTLEILAEEVGPASPKALEAILADTSEEALVEKGASILTSRIVTDGSRIYREAWDFWSKAATEAQQKRLRSFSPKLLALAVHELLGLHRLEQQLLDDAQAKATARAAGDETAAGAASQAIALRDQGATALRDVAGQHTARRAEVDAVVGTAEDAQALARGLSGVAGVLRGWLKSGDKALLGKLDLASLDEEYAGELEDAAQKVLATSAQAAGRRLNDKAAQAKLDWHDGVNVLLLGQIIRAFEAAHDLDRTIPRLVPISTRRLFNRNVSKTRKDEAKGGEEKPAEG